MSSNEPPYVVRRRETKRSEPISRTTANRIVLIIAAPANHRLGGTLTSTGYDVAAVSANPAQAFTLVASLQPDAVLFVVDALDVATIVRWGRAMRDQHEAALLLLSSDTSAETQAQFESVRAHGIVALPTTADALDTAIKAALRAKSAGPELIRLPEPVNDLAAHGNGLPVQRGLLERFAIASARAVRTGSPVAVGLVEIQCAKQ